MCYRTLYFKCYRLLNWQYSDITRERRGTKRFCGGWITWVRQAGEGMTQVFTKHTAILGKLADRYKGVICEGAALAHGKGVREG